MHGGTITLCRKLVCNDFIGDPLPAAFQDDPFHLLCTHQILERSNGDGDREHRCFASSPDNACLDRFRRGSVQHDFIDKAAQESFFLLLRKKPLVPERWKMLTDGLERCLKLLTEREQQRLRPALVGFGFLSPFEFSKRRVPSLFQLGSNESRWLQFRVETYNTFNHSQFTAVDNNARFDSLGNQVSKSLGQYIG